MNWIQIAAIGKNNELGKNNKLIWPLKKDLQFFKNTTMHSNIVMGRKTFQSLPKKLPGRHHIIISKNFISDDKDVEVFSSIDSFYKAYKNEKKPIYIIGGASIYDQLLDYCDTLILTEIEAEDAAADAFYPKFNKENYKKEILDTAEENGIVYSHVKYSKY